jgi:hypothetical protein
VFQDGPKGNVCPNVVITNTSRLLGGDNEAFGAIVLLVSFFLTNLDDVIGIHNVKITVGIGDSNKHGGGLSNVTPLASGLSEL